MNPRFPESPFEYSSRVEAPRSLFSRLPAFYRENSDLVGTLVEVAESLIPSFRDALLQKQEAHQGARFSGLRSPPHLSTQETLVRWLAERHGVAPRVWNGFEAIPWPTGGVQFLRSRSRAAVLAWETEQLPSVPEDFDLDAGCLPVSLRVAAVLLERLPQGGVPRSGEKLPGAIFWTL